MLNRKRKNKRLIFDDKEMKGEQGRIMSRIFQCIVTVIISLVVFGCASTKEVKPSASGQDNQPAAASVTQGDKVQETKNIESLQPAEEPSQKRPDEDILMPQIKKSLYQKSLPAKAERMPIDPKRIVHVSGNVILNAESMPLSDFIVYALGDTLRITFFVDEPVMAMKNPITLRMTQEMPAEKVVEVVIGFLEKNGLVVEEKGGALYIMKPKPPAVQSPPVDFRIGRNTEDSPANVFQFVPFRHLHGAQVMQLLGDLFKDVRIQWYNKENALMLSGPASSMKEMIDFIDFIDVPTLSDKKLFLFQLTYWQPDDFIRQISAILEGVGYSIAKGPADPGIEFIPIKYLNSILIVSPDDATLKFALDWKRRLDTAESAGTEEKVFTFTPQYSKASDLVDSIKKLYGVMPAIAPARGPQGVQAAPVGAAAPTATAAAAVPLPTTASVSPASPVSSVSSASIPGLKISGDDRRNIVVIISTPSIFKSVLAILQELDKPPKQVLIEAMIAELTLTDDLSYGLEWYLQTRNKTSGTSNSLTTLGQLGLNTSSGLVYNFLSDSQRLQAVVNAFAQQNKVNILSTPRIMVLDNQTATLNVGSQVPILGGQTTTSTVEGSTVNAQVVSYVTTGITVSVTPTINTEGLLTLQISVTDSQAVPNSTSSINSPLITNDSLSTSIVATTSETILLGGMMSDSVTDSESKVPLLGDIPLLGNLFKTRSKDKTKTELIIMLTPKILTSGDEAARITNEIRKSIKWLQ